MKEKYGLLWGDETSDIYIDLILAKHYREEPYNRGELLRPGEHLLRAARALFTPEEFRISHWTEERAHGWCEEDFIVNLGAASCGKSNDFGCFAVLDWITDPGETYVAMATTSLEMLKVRTFGAVSRYFGMLKRNPTIAIPGKLTGSLTRVVLSDEGDPSGEGEGVKASIRGVALSDGDEGKAIAKLAGAHLPYVTIILDEGSALPPAAAKARMNASAGTKRFRFVSLANPISRTDESCRFSEPVECEENKAKGIAGGWDTLDEYAKSWRSAYGLVIHNHAEDSPAIAEPALYPFLANRAFIDNALLRVCGGNSDDPLYWTMVKGLPRPDGGESAVASTSDFARVAMLPDNSFAVLGHVGGFDPSFTSGGDACMFCVLEVGLMNNGSSGAVRLKENRRIPLSSSSGVPMSYQAVNGAVAICAEHNISLCDVAIDDSGTQSVADIWEVETGFAPVRENFGAASRDFVGGTFLNSSGKSVGNLGPDGWRRYGNRVTEMWSDTMRAVRSGRFLRRETGVGGILGFDAEGQFCRRKYVKDSAPLRLETKREYKSRSGGKSPDDADAIALATTCAVQRFGFDVATGGYPSRRGEGFPSELRTKYGSVRDAVPGGSPRDMLFGSPVGATPLSGSPVLSGMQRMKWI